MIAIGKPGGVPGDYKHQELLKPGAVFDVEGAMLGGLSLSVPLLQLNSDSGLITRTTAVPDFNILIRDHYNNINRSSTSAAYSWQKLSRITGGGTHWEKRGAVSWGPTQCDVNAGHPLYDRGVQVFGVQPGSNQVQIFCQSDTLTTGGGSISWCNDQVARISLYVHFPGVPSSSFTWRDTGDFTVKMIREI